MSAHLGCYALAVFVGLCAIAVLGAIIGCMTQAVDGDGHPIVRVIGWAFIVVLGSVLVVAIGASIITSLGWCKP